MGHRREKHERKVAQQRIGKRENEVYYQHESNWHSPSSPAEIAARRTKEEKRGS
jgi:hypothetical protein